MNLRSMIRQVPGSRWLYRQCRRLWDPCGVRPASTVSKAELYDLQTVEVMRRVLRPSSTCLDGGAHRGSLLRHMVRLAPEGKHHAVEPLPHLARHLRAEFPGVVVHACALAERNGAAHFHFVENDPEYSGLRRRRYDRPNRKITEIDVAARRLDTLVPRDCRLELMKLDLEGGEYHALLGGRETLKRCRPFIIFEFGIGAADHYGVTPEMMWQLLVGEASMTLTTLERWLHRSSPLDRAGFVESYQRCHDFYFLAVPEPGAAR